MKGGFAFIFVLTAIILKSVFSADMWNDKLEGLIAYNIERHFSPKTIRLIRYETFNSELDWNYFTSLNNIPLLVGNNKPLIKSLDSRIISTGRMTGFHEQFKYVVIIWISAALFLEQLLHQLKMTINHRWDRLIILTEKEKLLAEIMSNPVTQDFKERFGLSIEKGNIWVDPVIYNHGKMEEISTSVMDIPQRKKVGGNLRGRHFKVAGAAVRPCMYNTVDAKGNPTYAGSHVSIVKAGAEHFNFTFDIILQPSYAELFPNGTWGGMYGKVLYPNTGYHWTITLGYEYTMYFGVDYASTLGTFDLMYATNQPVTKLEWYAFVLPFSITVWTYFGAAYVFLGVVQLIVMYFLHKRRFTYLVVETGYFLPFAIATEQGLVDIPKGARYMSLIWLMGCLVLSTGYKSTLRDHLSFPTPYKVPLTFDELADNPAYSINLFVFGFLETQFFEMSQTQKIINIRQRMKIDYDMDHCLRKVYQTPRSVCIGWGPGLVEEVVRSLTVNARVDPLLFSKSTPYSIIMTMTFPKDSIFLDSFYGVTEAAFESGLAQKWNKDENYISKKAGVARLAQEKGTHLYKLLIEQTKAGGKERSPLTMTNLRAIFAFLPIGAVIGWIICGVEKCIYNFYNKKRISLRKKILRR